MVNTLVNNRVMFFFFSSLSLLASKVAVGIILLGVSSEYVNNSRKESTGSALTSKEQVTNPVTTTNDPPVVDTLTVVGQPLEKGHTRSISLVHLNELLNQKRPSESPTLAPIDGGDELNETSFRDADDNYQCLTNDQNCPPVSTFSKASSPGITSNENPVSNINSTALSAITNIDEGIVFTAPPASPTAKKPDLNNVERYKMCGNSIVI